MGADGGGLGYANKAASGSTAAQPGLPNGYLGVGFDVFGNFASTSTNAAPQCLPSGTPSVQIKNSITLRGHGNDATGYCAVGESQELDQMGMVDNNGGKDLYDVDVTDPYIPDITCPATTLAVGDQMICTGSHTVTEADQAALHFLNQAVVSARAEGSDPERPPTESKVSSVDVAINPTAEEASERIEPNENAVFQILDNGDSSGLVTPDDPNKVTLELLNTSGTPSGNTVTFTGEGVWTLRGAPGYQVTFTPASDYKGPVTPIWYRATSTVEAEGVKGYNDGKLSVTIFSDPERVCSDAEHRASGRWWDFGTKAQLDFGVTGTELPGVGTIENVDSQDAATFTVTDMRNNLQFIVDPGQGRTINSAGTVMKEGGEGSDASDPIVIPQGTGASPVTVFPDGQGTGKYVVVTSSATATTAGQLTYRVIDMALNGGEGGLSGAPSTNLGTGDAGPAVTSVPDSRGRGYWVINPRRGTSIIMT